MSKPVQQYNKLAKLLHWLSAITIIGLFSLGLWMVDLNYYHEWYHTAPHIHKSVGLCLFAVTLVRIIWKKATAAPSIEGKNWEIKAAKSAHTLLYILLLGMFISGYMISTADGSGIDVFNWFTVQGFGSIVENQEDIAGVIHYYLAFILIGLAAVHASAALKHHFINKDNTLKKMI
ncbi:cytochrome b [Psychromonas sp.]|uniref:cytochrome b n=1 Tax=Psychromonas sp. TaxID=1884585 RepID=UPI0035678D67